MMLEKKDFFGYVCNCLYKKFKEILQEPSFFWSPFSSEQKKFELCFSKKHLKPHTIFFIPESLIFLPQSHQNTPYVLESSLCTEYFDVYPAAKTFQWHFSFATHFEDPFIVLKDISKLHAFLFSHPSIDPFFPKPSVETENLWKKISQEKAVLVSEPCSFTEEGVFFKFFYRSLYHNNSCLRQEKYTKQRIFKLQTKKESL